MKKYLFVMRHLPHVSSHVQEILDQILTTAAFDQTVSLLFLDDGVLQLKQGQNPAKLAGKETSAVFNALEIYNVNRLFVENESLASRGLDQDDLILPVQCIPRTQVNDLLCQHDIVMPD